MGKLASYLHAHEIEAGCDEAGRGCLAGPVFAAAVILPRKFKHPMLDDSKKLTEKIRDELRVVIEKEAIAWAVGRVNPKEIDKVNILNASFLAMHRAVDQLKKTPTYLLIDGNRFNAYKDIPHHCIIKGDAKYMSIAAASILAKTHRDEHMLKLHRKFSYYSWDTNKGYPTQAHRDAIAQHGDCIHHRQSFRLLPLPVQGELFEAV